MLVVKDGAGTSAERIAGRLSLVRMPGLGLLRVDKVLCIAGRPSLASFWFE